VEQHPTHLVRVRDGRWVCVVECGDPEGAPVFYFHGAPASRIGGLAFDEVATKHKVRLLVPDRPGIGFSDPAPGRRLLDWPKDVSDVADALGVERFGVLGASGGGPYSLACAFAIPERLTTVVTACCPGPMADDVAYYQGFNPAAAKLIRLAQRFPVLLRLAVLAMTRESKEEGKNKFTEKTTGKLPAADVEAMRFLASLPALVDEPVMTKRQGLRYSAQDLAVVFGRWGFRPQDVAVPVHLWHGELDGAVPVDGARLLAAAIPQCELHSVPQAGHNVPFTEMEEIFQVLGSGVARATVAS